MADDFQVKQSSSSSGAYALTGGVVGAAAGGVGAHYLTKPKYASHNDIINEAKDSADFKSKLEKAEGEEKKFLQAAKEVADEKANAEKTWNDEFKAFQESHKEGIKKDSDYIKLEEKQAEYQNKIKELEAKAQTNVSEKNVSKEPLALIRQTAKEADNANKELKELKNNNASKEAIDKVKARLKKYDAELKANIDKVVESANYGELKGEELDKAKKALKSDLMDYSRQYLEQRDKVVKAAPQERFKINKSNIAEEQKTIDNALKQIKELSGRDLTDALVNNKGMTKGVAFDKEIEAILKVENNKAETIKNLLNNFPSDKKVLKGVTARELLKECFKSLIHNTPMNLNGTVYDPEKAMQDFIDTLRPNEKELLKDKEVTKETLQSLINSSNERVNTLNEAAKTVRTSTSSISALNQAIEKNKEAVIKQFGEGAYINEEGVICRKGKPIELPKEKMPQMELPEFGNTDKLPKEVQIAKKSTTVTEAPELAEVRKNLEEVNKQLEAARKDLPKGELKPEEQLAEFAKSKGVKNKEEYLNNQVKAKADKFAQDFESQFKRKFGFAEHANLKIAGAAALGAIVLGGIFSAMAPKDKA